MEAASKEGNPKEAASKEAASAVAYPGQKLYIYQILNFGEYSGPGMVTLAQGDLSVARLILEQSAHCRTMPLSYVNFEAASIAILDDNVVH
jgi:hypothetical protein